MEGSSRSLFGIRAWLFKPITRRIDKRFAYLHAHVTYTKDSIMSKIDSKFANRLASLLDQAKAFEAKQQAESGSDTVDESGADAMLTELEQVFARLSGTPLAEQPAPVVDETPAVDSVFSADVVTQ